MTAINVPGLIRGGVVEKFGDADSWTATVAAGQAVVGGTLLEATAGDRVVQVAGAASVKVVGVAMYNAAAGETITVGSEGAWFLKASGGINAGDRVVAAADGEVAAAGATPDAREIVGFAMSDATNGNLVAVKLSL